MSNTVLVMAAMGSVIGCSSQMLFLQESLLFVFELVAGDGSRVQAK